MGNLSHRIICRTVELCRKKSILLWKWHRRLTFHEKKAAIFECLYHFSQFIDIERCTSVLCFQYSQYLSKKAISLGGKNHIYCGSNAQKCSFPKQKSVPVYLNVFLSIRQTTHTHTQRAFRSQLQFSLINFRRAVFIAYPQACEFIIVEWLCVLPLCWISPVPLRVPFLFRQLRSVHTIDTINFSAHFFLLILILIFIPDFRCWISLPLPHAHKELSF